MSAFIKPPEGYKRDLNFYEGYIDQVAFYLSKTKGIGIAEAKDFVLTEIEKKENVKFKDPRVKFLHRDKKTGDRFIQQNTLLNYIDDVTKHSLIMVPTMTVYYNPNQKKSKIATWILNNLQLRKKFKHLMFQAKMLKDKAKAIFYDVLQNSAKIKNNSLSGAHSSPSTPLYNKSTHSTLTSTCRISTSYANASNEMFLAGNRHYWSPQLVLNHLVCCSLYNDKALVEEVVEGYNLVYPTIQDTMECIKHSTDLYWRDESATLEIFKLVKTLTPVERALFVYSCDFYHLEKLNPEFVKSFRDRFVSPTWYIIKEKDDEVFKVLKDPDIKALSTLLCADIVKGRELDDLKEVDYAAYCEVAVMAKSIRDAEDGFSNFIHCFLRTDLLPGSIARLPNSIRKAVITSDTDSSIFTNQYWALKYSNGHPFSKEAYDTGHLMTFLVSRIVKHRLAVMSTNIGAVKEHLNTISMKNEYFFPVYVLTPVAKHYFAYRAAQEGRMLPEIETEIKGVHLRDSSAPAHVTKKLKLYMEDIMDEIIKGNKLKLDRIYRPIADIENNIIKDIRKGGYNYLKSVQVKDSSSYSQGEEAANYKRYTFWQETFAHAYGEAPKPPYQGVKVSVNLSKPRLFNAWVENIENKQLKDALINWNLRNGKKGVGVIVVPLNVVSKFSIPKEITDAVDIRELLKGIVSPFYLVLESLGIYLDNKHNSVLVSDHYKDAA